MTTQYGICSLSRIPVRATASEQAEMTTELLFGDLFEIRSKHGSWLYIQTEYDGYIGWICSRNEMPLTREQYEHLKNQMIHTSFETVEELKDESHNRKFPVLMGSSFPRMHKHEFKINDTEYKFTGRVSSPLQHISRKSLVNFAMLYLHAPYTWGGRNPFGIDCSGFVQMVFKMARIRLPRDAGDQAKTGELLSFPEEAQPGDLAFFDNEEGKIIHVGMILANSNIIHASGCVRIDNLDHHGIYHLQRHEYTHQLRLIRNVFGS